MGTKLGFFVMKKGDISESISAVWPCLDIAAVLITCDGKVLTVYNEKWGAFTLPMTKRRTWADPKVGKKDRIEDWSDAASRAAAEWLGRTLPAPPKSIHEFAEFQQSDRDEKWKRYRLRAFKLTVDPNVELPPCKIAEWLTPEELLDESRRPISPTARHIINELQLNGLV